MKKTVFRGLILALLACLLLGMCPAAMAENVTRAADASTVNNWKNYFGPGFPDTSNAGGVWTDKSVFMDESALNSALGANTGIQRLDSDNFLAVLSAIGSNKSIKGHSIVPTDTVFVVDFSGSMAAVADSSTGITRIEALINSLNDSIRDLLSLNVENRIGVVMYKGNTDLNYSTVGSSQVLLPLGRYTADNNKYLTIRATGDYSIPYHISTNVKQQSKITYKMSRYAGTYIQSGLLRAWEEVYSKADTVVPEGGDPLQVGRSRLPVMILMSDGAPTAVTSNFTVHATANGGNNRTKTTHDEMGFVTQLTASYVRQKLTDHYANGGKGHTPLVYTLGLALGAADDGSGTVGKSVMNPSESTAGINSLWNTYLKLSNGGSMTIDLQVDGDRNGTRTQRTVTRHEKAVNKNYVDRYFDTQNASQLTAAFRSIVREIEIQSLYYPTKVDSSNFTHDGYLVFEDRIGDFMEVKDIKGFVLGSKLYTGLGIAQHLHNADLGTPQNPTALGDEFIRSVRSRLGISREAAQKLVAYAWGRTLYYNSSSDYGNSLVWYADANGRYIDSWLSDWSVGSSAEAAVPSGAAFRVESFGFLDDVSSHGVNSNLMYVSVQLRTRLSDGAGMLVMKVPSILIPLVTTELEGVNLDEDDQGDKITYTQKADAPIRLVYEVGLNSAINPYTVAAIAGSSNLNADGSYTFYTNQYDLQEISALASVCDDSQHKSFNNTISYFAPSAENERYFYTGNTDLYIRNADGSYSPCKTGVGSGKPADQQLYAPYHVYVLGAGGKASFRLDYTEVADFSCQDMRQYTSGKHAGQWYLPIGTIRRYADDSVVYKTLGTAVSPVDKVSYPFVNCHSSISHAAAVLGNNGKITLRPAVAALRIEAEKLVKNSGSAKIGPEGFVFELLEKKGEEIVVVQTAESDAEGRIVFDLQYTGADKGKHCYMLREVPGDRKNVTYSTQAYILDVTVDYEQKNLVARGAWRDLENGRIPWFENEYKSSLPDTGDGVHPAVLLALACIGFSGAAAMLFAGRRRRENG